jgi:hypothetical protein
MLRWTVTEVAWLTLAQPRAELAAGAEDVAGAAGADDDVTAEPHPARAMHSSPATTVPRTWREVIMAFGRSPRRFSSIPHPPCRTARRSRYSLHDHQQRAHH